MTTRTRGALGRVDVAMWQKDKQNVKVISAQLNRWEAVLMQFFGDYHCHSRYSDGRQNVEDILIAAHNRGLQEVAITDHGPLAAVIGVKDTEVYFRLRAQIDALNQANNKIKVLLGAEANIRDIDGALDIPEPVIDELDILIAGLHPYTWPTSLQDGIDIFVQNSLRHLGRGQKAKAITANTKALVQTVYRNPRLDILSHPGLFFEVEIEEVAKACAQNQVLFEINCGHKHPDISAIMKAGKLGVDFIINSDAHFADSVGDLEYGSEVIAKLGLKEQAANDQERGGYKKWAKKQICAF